MPLAGGQRNFDHNRLALKLNTVPAERWGVARIEDRPPEEGVVVVRLGVTCV